MRAVKTCLHQRHKHKHKLSADVIGENTQVFFLFTPIINVLKAQVQENQTSSFFSSCAWTLTLWISDDQEENDCVPSSHASASAFVVDDLTELNCTGFACVYVASIN